MKSSFGICNFLEEISSLSHSVVFHCFFALIAEEGSGLARAFSRLKTMDEQVPMWTILKGSLSETNPFNSNQHGLQRQRLEPDGKVNSSDMHKLRFQGAPARWLSPSWPGPRWPFCIRGIVFHLAWSAWWFMQPFKGILWPAWKGNQLSAGQASGQEI